MNSKEYKLGDTTCENFENGLIVVKRKKKVSYFVMDNKLYITDKLYEYRDFSERFKILCQLKKKELNVLNEYEFIVTLRKFKGFL